MSAPPVGAGVVLPVASGPAVASRVWGLLAGRRAALAGVLVLFLVEAGTAVVFPLATGALVDVVASPPGASAALAGLAVAVLGAAVLAGLLAWGGGVALARLVETLIADLRERYVAAALALPRATVDAAGAGDVVTRASDDIAQLSDTLPQVLPRLTVAVFTLVIVGASLVGLDPWYLLGLAVVAPLHALTVRWYLRRAPGVYAAERAAESVRGQHILGTLTALPTVTAHRWGPSQLRRVRTATWETVRWAMRTRIVQNRLFGRISATEFVGLAAVLGTGVWLAASGRASAGEVTAAALLYLATVGPMAELLFVLDDSQSALASLGRIVGVIDAPGVPDAPGPTVRPYAAPGQAQVALVDVGFSYDGRTPTLAGITLALRPGESVAVVGATGSGKSTLASLVAGVHEPGGGRLTRAVAPDRVVTLTQEVHVLTGSVRDNLALVGDCSDARLEAAARDADAAWLLAGLPQGWDTPVGHGGHPLTAAQAQGIALLRVALADPAVVILDEATADADSADVGLLDRMARAVVRGRTSLVVAHRLSQAASCDRIVVLRGGRVIEEGDHATLLAAGDAYARMWAAWNGEPG